MTPPAIPTRYYTADAVLYPPNEAPVRGRKVVLDHGDVECAAAGGESPRISVSKDR
jgi:hypothetical protein